MKIEGESQQLKKVREGEDQTKLKLLFFFAFTWARHSMLIME